jgi:hypothetical protein
MAFSGLVIGEAHRRTIRQQWPFVLEPDMQPDRKNLIAWRGERADLDADTGFRAGRGLGQGFLDWPEGTRRERSRHLAPLIDALNARAAMPPFDKATARVACNAQGTPNWGAGPVVAMPNGDRIVTPRMVEGRAGADRQAGRRRPARHRLQRPASASGQPEADFSFSANIKCGRSSHPLSGRTLQNSRCPTQQ